MIGFIQKKAIVAIAHRIKRFTLLSNMEQPIRSWGASTWKKDANKLSYITNCQSDGI